MSLDPGSPDGPEEAVPAGPVIDSTSNATLTALYESSRAIGMRDCIEDLLDEVLDQAQSLIKAEHADGAVAVLHDGFELEKNGS